MVLPDLNTAWASSLKGRSLGVHAAAAEPGDRAAPSACALLALPLAPPLLQGSTQLMVRKDVPLPGLQGARRLRASLKGCRCEPCSYLLSRFVAGARLWRSGLRCCAAARSAAMQHRRLRTCVELTLSDRWGLHACL